jgi:hypothetical protein
VQLLSSGMKSVVIFLATAVRNSSRISSYVFQECVLVIRKRAGEYLYQVCIEPYHSLILPLNRALTKRSSALVHSGANST